MGNFIFHKYLTLGCCLPTFFWNEEIVYSTVEPHQQRHWRDIIAVIPHGMMWSDLLHTECAYFTHSDFAIVDFSHSRTETVHLTIVTFPHTFVVTEMGKNVRQSIQTACSHLFYTCSTLCLHFVSTLSSSVIHRCTCSLCQTWIYKRKTVFLFMWDNGLIACRSPRSIDRQGSSPVLFTRILFFLNLLILKINRLGYG